MVKTVTFLKDLNNNHSFFLLTHLDFFILATFCLLWYGSPANGEDCCLHIDQPPTSYLKNMYFDTTVFATDQLDFLARKYGSDKIVLGTDYPFDMADYDPTEHIMGLDGFSASEKEAMCGLNSANLLKVDVNDFARANPQENWS